MLGLLVLLVVSHSRMEGGPAFSFFGKSEGFAGCISPLTYAIIAPEKNVPKENPWKGILY